MKKIVYCALNAALALSLFGCANSDGTISGAETEGGTPQIISAIPIPYKVYFYVNHEPVKIDGCDYIAAEKTDTRRLFAAE